MARLRIVSSRDFVQIEGLDAVLRQLQRMSKDVLKDCAPVLAAEAADIISASRASIPVDSGHLSTSSFVAAAEASRGGQSLTVTCGYDAPYAAQAHEGFYGIPGKHGVFRRTASPPKFLERAADGRGSALANNVGAAMMQGLKRLNG